MIRKLVLALVLMGGGVAVAQPKGDKPLTDEEQAAANLGFSGVRIGATEAEVVEKFQDNREVDKGKFAFKRLAVRSEGVVGLLDFHEGKLFAIAYLHDAKSIQLSGGSKEIVDLLVAIYGKPTSDQVYEKDPENRLIVWDFPRADRSVKLWFFGKDQGYLMAGMQISTTLMVAKLKPPAAKAKPGVDAEELKKLEGEWRAVQVFAHGREVDQKDVERRKTVIEFKGGKSRIGESGRFDRWQPVAQLDGTTAPKQLDITTEPRENGDPRPGVYTLVGDKLTVRFAQGKGAARPTDTGKPKDESEDLWMVLERVRFEPEPEVVARKPGEDDDRWKLRELTARVRAKELQKLEGEWRAVEVWVGAKSEKVKETDFVLEFKGGKMRVTQGADVTEWVKVPNLDVTTDPHQLDLPMRRNDKLAPAVYQVDGKRLLVKFPDKVGAPRPKDLAKPKADEKDSWIVLEKVGD